MKTILTLLLTLTIFLNSKSQISFSCTYRSYCQWNDNTRTFENCSGYSESSLFTFNKSETMFTHTISSMTSTYYITKKYYDKELDIFTYETVSDIGNEYYYVIDMKVKEIRVLFSSKQETYMITFSVKSVF